jgi:cytochrome oxidase Cu insertion factor (SCO1/SenC/PrrC family)
MTPLRIIAIAASLVLLAPSVRAQTPDDRRDDAERREQYLQSRPALGEAASAFVLRDLNGKEFRLKSLAGKRPLVIEFGSYT